MYYGKTSELTKLMFKVVTTEPDGRILETYYPRVELSNPGEISDKAQGSGEFKDVKFEFVAKIHDNWTNNSVKQLKAERYINI